MHNLNKYTFTVRRQNLIKSIRNQQRMDIKKERRMRLHNTLNPIAEVYRLKEVTNTYNIQYFQPEIVQVVKTIQSCFFDDQFCYELLRTQLIDDLVRIVIAQLHLKSYLQAPQSVELLVNLLYELIVTKAPIFIKTVENNIGFIFFSLFKYPFHITLLQKIAQMLTLLENSTPSNNWRSLYQWSRVLSQELIVSKILELYVLRNQYECYHGDQLKVEQVMKGDRNWFKNAIKSLQISYNLLCLQTDRTHFWKQSAIRQSLNEGLRVFINNRQSWIESVEWNAESDCQTSSSLQHQQQHSHKRGQNKYEQNNLYFVSMILDILLLKQQLLELCQINLLRDILDILLRQLNKFSIINLTAIKIIKILYQQIIFDSDDLLELGQCNPDLKLLIDNIIMNDLV